MTKGFSSVIVVVSVLACHATASSAQGGVYAPKVGSPERTAILKALGSKVRDDIGKEVLFYITRLRVQGEWALILAAPEGPSRKRIDYRGTRYDTKTLQNEPFDDWICALLRKQQGRWKIVEYELGATDMPYFSWEEKYHIPHGIFEVPPPG